MTLIFIHFSCRIAPCQSHINQKERNEEQLMDSLYACLQKEDVTQYHEEGVLEERSSQCNFKEKRV